MDRRRNPSTNESDRQRRNQDEGSSSDASSSNSSRRSRNSHLIGRGINPRDWSNQQNGTNEVPPFNPERANAHFNRGNALSEAWGPSEGSGSL